MIFCCPHCGRTLHQQLNDGLAHCFNCNHVFDSSPYNQLLSAAWMVRRDKFSLEQLDHFIGLTVEEIGLISNYIIDQDYSHQEFVEVLKKSGVPQKSYLERPA